MIPAGLHQPEVMASARILLNSFNVWAARQYQSGNSFARYGRFPAYHYVSQPLLSLHVARVYCDPCHISGLLVVFLRLFSGVLAVCGI